jgi:hypothetical protein
MAREIGFVEPAYAATSRNLAKPMAILGAMYSTIKRPPGYIEDTEQTLLRKARKEQIH